MKCPTCGTEQKAGTLFCEICGALLKREEEPAASPVQAQAAPPPSPEIIPDAAPQPEAAPKPDEPPPLQQTFDAKPPAQKDGIGKMLEPVIETLKKPIQIGKLGLPLGAVASAGVAFVAVCVILIVILTGGGAPTEEQLAYVAGDWFENGDLTAPNIYIFGNEWAIYQDDVLFFSGTVKLSKSGYVLIEDKKNDLYLELEAFDDGTLHVYEGDSSSVFFNYEDTLALHDEAQTLAAAQAAKDIVLPANAPMDNMVILDGLGLIAHYPSTVFSLESSDSNKARFVSLKAGEAIIEIQSQSAFYLNDSPSNQTIFEGLQAFEYEVQKPFLANATNQVEMEGLIYYTEESSPTGLSGEASYTLDGVAMRIHTYTMIWRDISTNKRFLVSTTVVAPQESFQFYLNYKEKIEAVYGDV